MKRPLVSPVTQKAFVLPGLALWKRLVPGGRQCFFYLFDGSFKPFDFLLEFGYFGLIPFPGFSMLSNFIGSLNGLIFPLVTAVYCPFDI
ncbi:hypothetical protein L0244_29095 [bacterium]|nr:hypothetical protein [bacterium]